MTKMQITRTSIVSGKTHTMLLQVTPEQLAKWEAGLKAQHAFPYLTADEREFIMTGITAEEWDKIITED